MHMLQPNALQYNSKPSEPACRPLDLQPHSLPTPNPWSRVRSYSRSEDALPASRSIHLGSGTFLGRSRSPSEFSLFRSPKPALHYLPGLLTCSWSLLTLNPGSQTPPPLLEPFASFLQPKPRHSSLRSHCPRGRALSWSPRHTKPSLACPFDPLRSAREIRPWVQMDPTLPGSNSRLGTYSQGLKRGPPEPNLANYLTLNTTHKWSELLSSLPNTTTHVHL